MPLPWGLEVIFLIEGIYKGVFQKRLLGLWISSWLQICFQWLRYSEQCYSKTTVYLGIDRTHIFSPCFSGSGKELELLDTETGRKFLQCVFRNTLIRNTQMTFWIRTSNYIAQSPTLKDSVYSKACKTMQLLLVVDLTKHFAIDHRDKSQGLSSYFNKWLVQLSELLQELMQLVSGKENFKTIIKTLV